jgi:hypothetical protein
MPHVVVGRQHSPSPEHVPDWCRTLWPFHRRSPRHRHHREHSASRGQGISLFTLSEVEDLIEAGRRRGRDSGLQVRARTKLIEVEQRLADLTLPGQPARRDRRWLR